MSPLVRVIGCGNEDSADDAAGLAAVRMSRPALERVPGVEVIEAGPGLRILDLLEGAESVIVVDAVRTRGGGRPSGSIVRLSLPADAPGFEVAASSHGFGVLETVGLAAAVGRTGNVTVLGVEVEHVTTGGPISPSVQAALPDLVAILRAEVAGRVEARRKDEGR